jgi:ATP-dependent helicase/nuclease subunit A
MSRPTLQQQQASNPDQSVWVSASAGTGKTRVLVNRILRLLLTGSKPEKLLCITFTKAAAAEVLDRIQEVVLQWSIAEEKELHEQLSIILDRAPDRNETKRARRLLPVILQSPGGIKIMTIHAFCQSVLTRFPLEAQISPGFAIADEAQSQSLLHQAKDILLQETTEQNNPELFRHLARFFDRLDEKNQNNLIQSVLSKRYHLIEFLNTQKNFVETICRHIGIRPELLDTDPEQNFLQKTSIADIKRIIPELQQGSGKTPGKRAEQLLQWINNPNNAEDYCGIYLTDKGTIYSTLCSGLDKAPSFVTDFLQSEANRALNYIELKNKTDLALDTISLLDICKNIIDLYQSLKKQHSVLDYEDQILLTADLLKNPLDSQWVHYKLDGGIDHILVDEAQDTSPAQWNIIKGITSDFFHGIGRSENKDRSLFIVGDEKQSIFSFQNADPIAFSHARHFFANQAQEGGSAWQDISLIDNFRSAPLILQLTDQVFSDQRLAAYISHDQQNIQHHAFHAKKSASIELWPLVPLPENDSYTAGNTYQLADAIATHAQKLISTVGSNDKEIRPGDIMILVRKRNPLVGPLTKAFKDRNIPVTSADRLVLKDQLAVQDCLIAIQSCLHHHDDYALACFLKSPFIGLTEDQLYHLCLNRNENLWECLKKSDHTDIISYVLKLSEAVRNMMPGHFIHTLLSLPCPADQRSGRHALIKRLGYDCDDVLDELLLTAYEFEDNYNASAQAFVTWMQNNQTVIKRANSELDKSRVQIMTVHASKGLQAPIVILADANAKPDSYKSVSDVIWSDKTANGFLWGMGNAKDTAIFEVEKQRYIELQFSEYYRLLYVALTRAEEALIICGWQPKKQSHKDYPSWYDSVSNAVQQLKQNPVYQVQEIQRFKQDGVKLVQSGVVNPVETKLKTVTRKKLIPANLLENPVAEPKILRPLRPSRPPEEQPSVFSPLQPARKDPYKRGQILHTLFRLIPDYPVDEQEEALHNLLAHHISDPAEQQSMAQEVMKVLHDKTFAHLFTPQAKAEVPVVGEVELDGQTYAMSGQIDRLLIEEDRVLIVDYKTNRPPVLNEAEIPAAYRYQLRAYKALMQKIYPDKRIETALLWTSIPYLLSVSG